MDAFNADYTPDNINYIMRGFWMTIRVAFVSIIFSIAIGTVLGIVRSYGNFILRKLAGFYIELFRKTPNLLWVYCRPFPNRLWSGLLCLCAFHLCHDGRDCARRFKLHS